MDNGITPVMSVNGGGDSWGLNGFGGIIGLLAVLGLANGGFGFGNNNQGNDALAAAIMASNNANANAIGYENLATSAEVQRGFDNQNSMAQSRDILTAVTNGTAQTIAASTANATNAINAIKDGNAALIREFGTVETALTALSGKQQECCCNILQKIGETSAATDALIARNNYDAAMRDAATNANFIAQIQSVKDLFYQQRDQEQQARIQNLELQQAMNGVLRFPNSWSYGAGPFPPIFGGCPNNI